MVPQRFTGRFNCRRFHVLGVGPTFMLLSTKPKYPADEFPCPRSRADAFTLPDLPGLHAVS